MEKNEIQALEEICQEMRIDCLKMAKAAGSQGFHFGATFSIIEVVAVLYLKIMNFDKKLLKDESRDRFILSKGHGVPAIYAALKQLDILTEEELLTFKGNDTELHGHPCKNEEMAIEFSSGSLGQGLSFAVGISLALKQRKNKAKCYVILGDGECNEGSVWEAVLSASKYALDNLVVVVDCNQLQYDGTTNDVMPMDSMVDKWKSFGWEVLEIDGHNIKQCYDALHREVNKPYVIIAKTIKGKGISFMENVPKWHYGIMTRAEEEQAWNEVLIDGDR